jgi:hypothetical protein
VLTSHSPKGQNCWRNIVITLIVTWPGVSCPSWSSNDERYRDITPIEKPFPEPNQKLILNLSHSLRPWLYVRFRTVQVRRRTHSKHTGSVAVISCPLPPRGYASH